MSTNTPITADFDGTTNIIRLEALIAEEQTKKAALEAQLESASGLSSIVVAAIEARIAKRTELIAAYEQQLAEAIVDALEGGEE